MTSSIDERFVLTPLSKDELTTCKAIASPTTSQITVMPTHHMDEFGNFMGFRFSSDPYIPGNQLPIGRTMFYGTTMVQCDISEEDILKLMSTPTSNREKMLEFLTKINSETVPATLACIPENSSSHTHSGTMQAIGMTTVDSKFWSPNLPTRIGIYHAYIKGYNRDVRTHRLFIICSGGLDKACDEFSNLIIDVGSHWTAHEVMISEEAWWLKKACQRARCQLIKKLADFFGLSVSHMEDIQSFRRQLMAIPTTDTLEHDISSMQNGKLAVYNMCMDTTKNMNGMLCNMHPSEGVWLFKGAQRNACYGSMYGDHGTCGVFPINSPQVSHSGAISVSDAPYIVRLNTPQVTGSKRERYMCFDESYFKVLENMQWNRDNGVEALMPIVVGMQ